MDFSFLKLFHVQYSNSSNKRTRRCWCPTQILWKVLSLWLKVRSQWKVHVNFMRFRFACLFSDIMLLIYFGLKCSSVKQYFGVLTLWCLVVSPLVVQPENANTAENQAVEEPQASRFTWTIDNFTRLNVKKLYSEVFIVGGYKW